MYILHTILTQLLRCGSCSSSWASCFSRAEPGILGGGSAFDWHGHAEVGVVTLAPWQRQRVGEGVSSLASLFLLLVLMLSTLDILKHFSFFSLPFWTMISEPDGLFKVGTPEAKRSAEPRPALPWISNLLLRGEKKITWYKRKQTKKKVIKKNPHSVALDAPALWGSARQKAKGTDNNGNLKIACKNYF